MILLFLLHVCAHIHTQTVTCIRKDEANARSFLLMFMDRKHMQTSTITEKKISMTCKSHGKMYHVAESHSPTFTFGGLSIRSGCACSLSLLMFPECHNLTLTFGGLHKEVVVLSPSSSLSHTHACIERISLVPEVSD